MTWKVKLSGAPTSSLQYHYLKSSFDPQDTNNVYNLLDDKILTPKGWKAFGQAIDVELTVKQDGTAIPCFVYGKGNNYQRIEGKPFYLDMTYATKHASEGTFLGIDFGTATTAASIVSEKDVRAYQERAEDKNWLEISDMVDTLPYCISQNLARYISETDRAMLDRYGKNTLESMLSFVAYLCFADISVTKPEKLVNRISSQPPFKRSAGPLLNLIRSMKNLNLEGTFLAKRMLAPLDESVISKIEHATKQLNDSKHGGDIYTDYNSLLKSLGNSINKAMSGFVFGRFEATKKQSFGGSYDGIFRVLSGKNQPFVSALTYKGYQDFAEHEIYIVDQHDKSCICISPFFIWGLDGLATGNASEELFSFDKFDRNSIKFNPTGVGPSISSGEHEHLEELWKYIENYFAGGIEYKIIKKVTLTERKN